MAVAVSKGVADLIKAKLEEHVMRRPTTRIGRIGLQQPLVVRHPRSLTPNCDHPWG